MRVAPAVDRLAQLAVNPGGGDIEDRSARPPVVEGEAIQRLPVGIDLDRLHELADGGPLLLRQEVETEHLPSLDQLVGEGLLLHADPDELGFEADLRRPVERHAVAPLPIAGANDIQPVRHLPQHTPAELVVLLLLGVGLDALGEGADGRSGLGGHPRTLPRPARERRQCIQPHQSYILADMAKRLVDIDDELLARAKRSAGTRTIKATVEAGLQRLVADELLMRHVRRLRRRGSIDLQRAEEARAPRRAASG
jgi:Arc/MetJ family transcription regulator